MPSSKLFMRSGWRYPVIGWHVVLFSVFPDDRPFSVESLGIDSYERTAFLKQWTDHGLLERPAHGIVRALDADWVAACREATNDYANLDRVLGSPIDLAVLASLPHAKYGPQRYTVNSSLPGRSRAHQRMDALGWMTLKDGNFGLGVLPPGIQKLVKAYGKLHETPPEPGLGPCIHQYGVEAAWSTADGIAYYGPRALSPVDKAMLRACRKLGKRAGEPHQSSAIPDDVASDLLGTLTFGDLNSDLGREWFEFYGLQAMLPALLQRDMDLRPKSPRTHFAADPRQHMTCVKLQKRGLIRFS